MRWRRLRKVDDEGRADGRCGSCGGPAVVDVVDLVVRSSSLRCLRCGHLWSESTVGARAAS